MLQQLFTGGAINTAIFHGSPEHLDVAHALYLILISAAMDPE